MKHLLVTGLLCVAPGLGLAQQGHDMTHTDADNHAHGMMPQDAVQKGMIPMVSEPGQAAFAAIAEIVTLLVADPTTDWGKVNITALREHLRDMDVVTIDAKVMTIPIEGGLRFVVSGASDVATSIRRMVPTHAAVMQGQDGWTYAAEETDDGAILDVIVPGGDLVKLNALGFFGVLAMGGHHQAHHLMMATGRSPH